MNERVLLVDDESTILEAYQQGLVTEFHIDTASGAAEGLAMIQDQGPYAVVVADRCMPGMDGIQFLMRVKEVTPSSVRIMLTGHADSMTTMEAVNEGNVFRFLSKPCSLETLSKALAAAVEQYRLVTAEKELLEKTLTGSIQMLADMLSFLNPAAFTRAGRVRRLVNQIAAQLKVEEIWQVEVAAMLSQVACLTVSEEILTKVSRDIPLTLEESRIFESYPQRGHDLIARIPRLEAVAEIIAYQEKHYNGSGFPGGGKTGEDIPIGARVLKIALDFDRLEATGARRAEILEEIQRRGYCYDPSVVEALHQVLSSQSKYELKSAKVEELTLKMILAEDIISLRGLVLFFKGQEVNTSVRGRLMNLVRNGVIEEEIRVLVPVQTEIDSTHKSENQIRSILQISKVEK